MTRPDEMRAALDAIGEVMARVDPKPVRLTPRQRDAVETAAAHYEALAQHGSIRGASLAAALRSILGGEA